MMPRSVEPHVEPAIAPHREGRFMPIAFTFFDIGGTLGDWDPGRQALTVFNDTVDLLTRLRTIHMRLGIITTLGSLSIPQGRNILTAAGLSGFFEQNGFISEHNVGGRGKPYADIYRFAARRVGVGVGDCLFVGEDLAEVIGAQAAGMQAVLKPRP
jgi:FMN phosphatase YigB (HAD superfamily)